MSVCNPKLEQGVIHKLGLELENNEVVTTEEGDAWPKLTSTLATATWTPSLAVAVPTVDATVSPAVRRRHSVKVLAFLHEFEDRSVDARCQLGAMGDGCGWG